ncbi:MAG: hypothetical protein RIQ41_107 [Candidatus Parcubacteria bacterium]|jgi:hypothetical protein
MYNLCNGQKETRHTCDGLPCGWRGVVKLAKTAISELGARDQGAW